MSRAVMHAALAALALVMASAGCGKDEPVSALDRGSVQVALRTSAGVSVDQVSYEITGGDFNTTGTLTADDGGTSVTGVIAGIPAGSGYTLALSARTSDTSCSGSAPFEALAGQTTNVEVVIKCRNEEPRGTVTVNGQFDVCPVLASVSASPANVPVGQAVALRAQASDEDDSGLEYLWSALSGTFIDAGEARAVFTCAQPGQHTLTVEVRDGLGCTDSITIDVRCGDGPAPGDAGSSTDAAADTDGAAPGGDAGVGADAGGADGGVAVDAGNPTDGGAGIDAGGSAGITIPGTWIARIQTPGTIEAPVVGSVGATIDLIARIVVTGGASGFQERLDLCRLQTTSTPNASALSVSYPPAVIATFSDTREQPAFSAQIGAPFPVPTFTISSGLDAANQPVDEDADGNPGVTLPSNIGGLLALDAYVGLSITTSFTAQVTAADAISGTTAFSVSGTVFGSNNPVLSSGSINVVPSSSSVPVTARRLEGDVSCGDVVSMFP